MIRFIPKEEAAAPAHPFFGPVMDTFLACQRPEDREPEWWVQDGADKAHALLCRSNGVFSIHASPYADGAEIARFVQLAGFTAAQLPPSLVPAFEALGCRAVRRMLLTRSHPPAGKELPLPIGPSQLELVAREVFPQFAARDDNGWWVWDFSRKARAGRALAAGIPEGDRTVCAGAVTHRGTGYAVLGYISCLPPFQGRGLASRLVNQLCAFAFSQGETPALLCRPELLPFYQSLGFALREPVWEVFSPLVPPHFIV